MRSTTAVTLAVVGIVCIALSAGVAAGDDVTLTVSVVDEDDDAVGDATVEATWDDGEATGTTASNGKVFMDVPEGADVELDIDDDRYVRNQPLTVRNAEEQEVELRVARQGQATLTVTDTDGDPLSEANVRLRADGNTIADGETDADGVYRVEGIEQREYRLSTVKPGFFRERSDLTVGDETQRNVTLESGRVTLDVEVVDDHFEEPQPLTDTRVRIEADVFDADVSASDGSASVNVPVNARYTIGATKDGYEGTPRQVSVTEERRSVTVSAQRTHELVATASNNRVVVGERTRVSVVNAYDEPVSGATVRLNDETVGETDDRGELSVELETVGESTIVADDGRVESDSVTVTVVDPDAESGDDTGTDGEQPDEEPEETPGFGVGAAVLALLVALAVAAVRRR